MFSHERTVLCQVVELDDGHGDGVTKRDDQVLQLKKEEREKTKTKC